MAKNIASEPSIVPHALSLNDRKELNLTGVSEVLSFDEVLVCLKTNCGNMQIRGKDLHVQSLLLEDTRLSLSGQIDAITYANQRNRRKKSLLDLLR